MLTKTQEAIAIAFVFFVMSAFAVMAYGYKTMQNVETETKEPAKNSVIILVILLLPALIAGLHMFFKGILY